MQPPCWPDALLGHCPDMRMQCYVGYCDLWHEADLSGHGWSYSSFVWSHASKGFAGISLCHVAVGFGPCASASQQGLLFKEAPVLSRREDESIPVIAVGKLMPWGASAASQRTAAPEWTSRAPPVLMLSQMTDVVMISYSPPSGAIVCELATNQCCCP